jgi:hypothetical protein
MDNTVDTAIQNNQLPANQQDAGQEKIQEIRSESPRVSLMTPRPVEVKKTNLFNALKLVYQGERFTRAGWEDSGHYIILAEDRLKLYSPDGKLHDWIISSEDLAAEDWVSLI